MGSDITMANNRKIFSTLVQSGVVPTEHIEQALCISGISPDRLAWQGFLSNLLLWLGGLALSSSVLFFIAYNWIDLGRFTKFGLLETLIVLCILGYWKSNKNDEPTDGENATSSSLISQLALLMASVFLGVLLAFFGQTYQTGADTWQLFFTWCILMLPWAIIARFPALWIVWLALLNVSIIFYSAAFRSIFSFVFTSETSVLWVLTIVNVAALIIWELLKNSWQWLSQSWATRVIAFAGCAPLTVLVIESIFNQHSLSLPWIFWMAALLIAYVFYRKLQPDLFMLAIMCLSAICIIVSLAGKVVFDNSKGAGSFLILALLIIGLGAASATWLKKTHQEFSLKHE